MEAWVAKPAAAKNVILDASGPNCRFEVAAFVERNQDRPKASVRQRAREPNRHCLETASTKAQHNLRDRWAVHAIHTSGVEVVELKFLARLGHDGGTAQTIGNERTIPDSLPLRAVRSDPTGEYSRHNLMGGGHTMPARKSAVCPGFDASNT